MHEQQSKLGCWSKLAMVLRNDRPTGASNSAHEAEARTCIIEIGRELIAAKAEVPHGEWATWLKAEFNWAESTARRYMQIADAFKSLSLSDLPRLEITGDAFYALASPTVPHEVRAEAVQRAEAGQVITKKAAEEMVRKAEEKAKGKVAELIQKAVDEQAAQDAIDAATELEIRAEKRMADEHAKLGLHRGGRPGNRSSEYTGFQEPKLDDIGLDKNESRRLKALAETPAPILDAIIEAHKEQKVPLTSAGVTRASKAAAEASWSPADIKANPLPTAANKPACTQQQSAADSRNTFVLSLF